MCGRRNRAVLNVKCSRMKCELCSRRVFLDQPRKIYLDYIMSKATTFFSILAFYVFISHILFPFLFYSFVEKTLASAGNGFVLGSVLSILLWIFFGSKMV